MSNVHRISDYDNQGPSGQAFPAQQQRGQRVPSQSWGQGAQGQPQQGQGQPQGMGMGMGGGRRMMFFSGDADDGDTAPYPALNKVLARDYKPYTFIFGITVIQIIMFICELLVGQFKYDEMFDKHNEMAGPGTETFVVMGAKYLPRIQKGEIFRFVVPAVLHAGILHIFTNLVSQTMIGYTCEKHWGLYKTAFFYGMTAFGATLLSCVGSPCSVSVGASGALLGIIGAHMMWILVNWNNQEKIRGPCQRMCTMIWWLFIIFMIGISVPGIDNLAHLGGWLTGVMLGLSFCEYTEPVGWVASRASAFKKGAMGLCIVYYLVTLLCTFLAVKC